MLFYTILDTRFENSVYRITEKPKDLQSIYNSGTKKKGKGSLVGKHGVKVDFKIENTETGKAIFVEMKRQNAGRGNAHERACKFCTPGLITIARKKCNLPKGVYPFLLVFSNGIAKDPKRIEEINYWFNGWEGAHLFWENLKDRNRIKDHFDNYIRLKID